VSIEDRRALAASALRDLGHEFISTELSEEQLERITRHAQDLLNELQQTQNRTREVPVGSLVQYKMAVPEDGSREKHQLFADSVVSGGANPMGLNATLWREGEVAFMEATFEKAFEGAPGRAHGGIVAALIDETMGLVMSIQGLVAFTVQLDVSYRAPTPVFRPIVSKGWLEKRDGRKLYINCEVTDGDVVCAEAKGIFVSVDPAKFLASITVTK